MKVYRKNKIKGRIYTYTLQKEVIDVDDGSELEGQVIFADAKIQIKKAMADHETFKTTVHEEFHAWLKESGVELTAIKPEELEETVCGHVEEFVYAMIPKWWPLFRKIKKQ